MSSTRAARSSSGSRTAAAARSRAARLHRTRWRTAVARTSIRAPISSTWRPTSSWTRPARPSSRPTRRRRSGPTTATRSSRSASSARCCGTTPTIVTPTGVAGLTFEDEADTANALVRSKNAKHVGAWVLVIHQGGQQSGTAALNGCAGNLAGSDIDKIAQRLDPRIKVIVSAHTHNEYRCTVTAGGVTRLVTSAASFGRILTRHHADARRQVGRRWCRPARRTRSWTTRSTCGSSATTIRQPDPSKEDPAVAGGCQPVRDRVGTTGEPGDRKHPGRPDADRLAARRVDPRRRDRRRAATSPPSRPAWARRSSPS